MSSNLVSATTSLASPCSNNPLVSLCPPASPFPSTARVVFENASGSLWLSSAVRMKPWPLPDAVWHLPLSQHCLWLSSPADTVPLSAPWPSNSQAFFMPLPLPDPPSALSPGPVQMLSSTGPPDLRGSTSFAQVSFMLYILISLKHFLDTALHSCDEINNLLTAFFCIFFSSRL